MMSSLANNRLFTFTSPEFFMNVLAIRLRNFMAFEDTGWIDLHAINLLFGRNSSGKSVIIRALRLLKQSVDAKSGIGPLVLTAEDGVDLGAFTDMTHKHGADNRRPWFCFRCSVRPELFRELSPKNFLGESEEVESWIEIEMRFDEEKHASSGDVPPRLFVSYLVIYASWSAFDTDKDRRVIFGADLVENDVSASPWYFWSDFLPIYEDEVQSEIWNAIELRHYIGFIPSLTKLQALFVYFEPEWESDSYDLIQRFLEQSREAIKNFLSSIVYVPPIRPKPRRLYFYDKINQYRSSDRESASFYRFLSMGTKSGLAKKLNYWISKLALGEEVTIESTFHRNQRALIFEVNVFEGKKGVTVSLQDTGFGASQVIPVILECLLAQEGAFVIIEQPELHLHPSAQADLADLFITLASASEKKRCLIETHSEHLLLRLQKRIAQTTRDSIVVSERKTNEGFSLSCDDLQAIYIERGEAESDVYIIRINKFGEMIETPMSFRVFFSSDFDEIYETDKAIIAINTAR